VQERRLRDKRQRESNISVQGSADSGPQLFDKKGNRAEDLKELRQW
jgi:hypothetical protein